MGSAQESWNQKELAELDRAELLIRYVSRIRQLVHIYSIVYYHLGYSDLADSKWDSWSERIVEIQDQFPWLKHEGYLAEWFYDWTGTTGMHLPQEGWALTEAQSLAQEGTT